MPRHLISDAHEWINEIPTVPLLNLLSPPFLSQRGDSFCLLQCRGSPLRWWLPGPSSGRHVAMAAPPPPFLLDNPPPAVLFPVPVSSSPTSSDPTPKNPKSPPNPAVSSPSGHATTSTSAPAHLSYSADPPPPPDPFPPLPSARPTPAAATASPAPNPLLPHPPPHPSPSLPSVPPFHALGVAAGNHPPPPLQPSRYAPPPSSACRNPGPIPIKSFAQATRFSRGPGFVRAHAADVEAFARLPRTGVNIVCGSREGVPSFSFTAADLPKVEEIYANALVMKFHGGRPSLESSHKEIQSWGIENPFSIGPLSSRAFLLRFQDYKDLIRVLSRPSSTLITFPYKVFRWHNLCHRQEDSCFAPVWISLPKLPLQCFIPEFLESVANKIGRFLCIDKATATLARPSTARVCVELDLRKPPPQSIWIWLFEGLNQPIIYERMPKFCNSCQVQGHMVTDCSLGQRETRPHQIEPRPMSTQSRPPPARHNVVERSSVQQHTQPPTTRPPASRQHTPRHMPSTSQHQQSAAAVLQVQRPADPPASLNPRNPQHSANHPPPSCSLCSAQGHAAVECPSGHREATAEQADPLQSSFKDCTPSVRQNVSQKLQSTSDQQQASLPTNHGSPNPSSLSPTEPNSTSVPTIPQVSPATEDLGPGSSTAVDSQPHSPAYNANLVEDQQIEPIKEHPISAANSIKLKQPDGDINPSLTKQQQEALERFKKKVRAQTQSLGQQLIGSTSANPFEALIEDQSDDEDDDYTAASFNSDTDDGSVEPIDMGYQSADGRSSHNHTKTSAPIMKTNKRHPNIPLNVRLRARKNSYSSSHRHLCM